MSNKKSSPKKSVKRGATKIKPVTTKAVQVPNKNGLVVIWIVVFIMATAAAYFIGKSNNDAKKMAAKSNVPSIPKATVEVKKTSKPATPKVYEHVFYTLTDNQTEHFDINDLAKIDKQRAELALRGKVPAPISKMQQQDIKEKQSKPNTIQQTPTKINPVIENKPVPKIKQNNSVMESAVPPNNLKVTPQQIDNAYYFWQVGSFQNRQDAEKLRTKITALGQISNIESNNVKGVLWHRVMVGPIVNRSEVKVVQQKLTANGLTNLLLHRRDKK